MADSSEEGKGGGSSSSNWVLTLLEVLERLLPAFLVLWNNSLRQENRRLEVTASEEKITADVANFKAAKMEEDAKKSSLDVINGFLSGERSESSGSTTGAGVGRTNTSGGGSTGNG